jgi:hypothetical protein
MLKAARSLLAMKTKSRRRSNVPRNLLRQTRIKRKR